MVLNVSLLIIIARQLKGMVSVSQSLRRISGANGHDIISSLSNWPTLYSRVRLYLRNYETNSEIV